MSKSKHIDLICGIGAVVMMLLTVLFLGGGGVFLEAVASDMPYVSKLFDTDRVHTVDIVADGDDWQGMLQNATAEEYISCSLVIDGESYKNVAIRPKGNSSLSQVASSDSDRYSFKIEFDHYDSSTNYHGLDKLCLNNIIQDNTYLKDYLCYQMMNFLGADAPLSSFVWITVNGQDWGLYLAVEGIEEAFAQREYGSDYGQIYKPDSINMGGGGRGAEAQGQDGGDALQNGFGGQDMFGSWEDLLSGLQDENGKYPEAVQEILHELEDGTLAWPGDAADILARLEEAGVTLPDGLEQMAELASQFQNGGGMGRGGFPGMPAGGEDAGENGEAGTSQPPASFQGETGDGAQSPELPDMDFGGFEGFGGFGGMGGSDDVLLVYSDDDPDSYPNIFDNAVFDTVSGSDEDRLIQTLKKLNEGDIEGSVNIDEVLRYFVVHNFVLNGDSYTGSIIHNYYLYEDEGVLSMIAWDYNLAFGGMGMGGTGSASSGATSSVNSPIDSPVASGDISQRPMVAWIFEDESYTQQYHQVFSEFISTYFDSGYFEDFFDSTIELISPYVEKDPTAFCTYEEFLKGSETLKEFCLLRAESIQGQLDGTIPSTTEGQSGDSSALVDASHISVSDMGSQGGGMGGMDGMKLGRGAEQFTEQAPEQSEGAAPETDGSASQSESGKTVPSATLTTTEQDRDSGGKMPGSGEPPEGGFSGTPPEGFDGEPPQNGEMPAMPGAETDGAAPDAGGGTSSEGTGGETAAPAEEGGGQTASQAPEASGGTGTQDETQDQKNGGADGGQANGGAEGFGGRMMGGMGDFPGGSQSQTQSGAGGLETWLLLGGSGVLLLAGLLFAKFYH